MPCGPIPPVLLWADWTGMPPWMQRFLAKWPNHAEEFHGGGDPVPKHHVPMFPDQLKREWGMELVVRHPVIQFNS